ncbi:hypothetical protein ACT3SZ_13785 [Corynebacterium sp. AOP40-9SA-29]|uniref:hypothetical protein n=1 Tax=Corynebacterium sp. AOP40-9SA-29 TaxID=3457677 RepID=UPI0040349344
MSITTTLNPLKRPRALAAVIALTAGLSVTACSSDDSDDSSSETTAAQTTETTPLPDAQELGDILARAVDPGVPAEEKADTVENGEQAVDLFDVMIQSQQESGATFEVIDPILPGNTPDEVMATMNLIQPDAEPVRMDGVKFINDNGQWKLSQEWACTLVSNVAPDQVPESCAPFLEEAPDPAAEQDAPAEDVPAAEPAA